jgi:hypothetical protein
MKRRNKMNIRKALLLTLIIAIATLGLTFTGCEKKSDEPTAPKMDTPAVEDMAEDAEEAAEEMAEDAEDAAEEAAAEHPTEHPK